MDSHPSAPLSDSAKMPKKRRSARDLVNDTAVLIVAPIPEAPHNAPFDAVQ